MIIVGIVVFLVLVYLIAVELAFPEVLSLLSLTVARLFPILSVSNQACEIDTCPVDLQPVPKDARWMQIT